jgi:hypothetical protein
MDRGNAAPAPKRSANAHYETFVAGGESAYGIGHAGSSSSMTAIKRMVSRKAATIRA